MKKNYQTKTASAATTDEVVLPAEVSVAMAELAGAMKEGLLAMAVGAGMQVMAVMMEDNVTTLAGVKGRHDPDRSAVRHGSEAGSVTLGGRQVPVRRPRVRTADRAAEVPVPTYELFSSTDLLGPLALEKMMAKLSTRRYADGLEPVGTRVEASARSTSRSAVSRRFVAATEAALAELMGADLSGLDLVAIMIDGVHFADHLCVVALGIDIDGTKHPLGLVEGDTENATVVKDLLAGLRDRGMDVTRPILAVLDGAKALTTAVNAVFDHPVIQRCQLHKNVTDHLARDQRGWLDTKLARAFNNPDPVAGLRAATELAKLLDDKHPDAAASLREGLDDMFTVRRLGLSERLCRTLTNTNTIESMISVARTTTRNVKRWRDGKMIKRWVAAGMLNAERSFRRIKGAKDMPTLLAALARHVDQLNEEAHHDTALTA